MNFLIGLAKSVNSNLMREEPSRLIGYIDFISMRFILILPFLTFNLLFGQKYYLLNSSDNSPIKYANVYWFHNNKLMGGTYSNNQGLFEITDSKTIDSLVISAIGFQTICLPPASIPDTLFMEEKSVLLEEVEITPENQSSVSFLGYAKERALPSTASEGYQMVVLISNPYPTEKRIKSSHFHFSRLLTNRDAVFKVVFFNNEEGRPAVSHFREVIILISDLKSRKAEIDLDSLHIMLPKEGLFVGIEWMGCIDSTDPSEKCRQAIMVNSYPNQHLLNQSFVRRIHSHLIWVDYNDVDFAERPSSTIPAFGITVYH
jgi:hypothetical protein